jgi:integrase
VDLAAGTITIEHTRPVVEGTVITKAPKSQRGIRTLPRERAGIERITLRNSRATANTLMADAGVPDHIRAAWCGHTVAVNVASYTAARQESLSAALGALSAVHNPV